MSRKIDYGKELNEEQRGVVLEESGPLLVIAGAGSGKTRTLTYRVARLIETGVPPNRILLATFTNKAAWSMLSRVRSLLGLELERFWGGTFHSVAHRILRRHADRLGYERSFSILDAEDAVSLVKACIAELDLKKSSEKFPKAEVVQSILSFSANTDTPVGDVVFSRHPFFISRADDMAAVAGRYRERKRKLQAMDFDDLLLNVRQLLAEHPEALEEYRGRFLHVLVDEYQDTNVIQADLVDLLASGHRNLMVVGDDSQSIYSFRGADFHNILRFPERYPDCRVFRLETNYRSTPEILNLANLSIRNNEKQFEKTLRAVRTEGVKPVLATASSVLQQAQFVVQRILELESTVPLRDIAVLYRAHYHSMELQMEMTRRGIPFEIRSGIRFFEQAHIKDVTAYLRILANPGDELAWKRVLPLYGGLGKVAAEKVWRFVSSQSEPLASLDSEAFLKGATRTALPGLKRFREVMRRLWEQAGDATVADLIGLVLEEGYRDHLYELYPEASFREEDLQQLANFSGGFERLEDFLNELALLTNLEKEDVAASSDADKVTLSTIHQAKGLEWSSVFLIWCAEGMLPLARALNDEGGVEEERRLFYVASTRAKDQLYLCYPVSDYRRGMGSMIVQPSRFIRELAPRYQGMRERPYEEWLVDEA
ncbi:MAG TPA: ATP-dependent helicase [Syntrophales bacterium]|nr:ATP-dependent helicase [Syntrophales bacterium]